MVVPCEDSYELDPLLAMCPINFILHDFIRLIIYFVSNTNFEASHYAVFSILLPIPLTQVPKFCASPCSLMPSAYVLVRNKDSHPCTTTDKSEALRNMTFLISNIDSDNLNMQLHYLQNVSVSLAVSYTSRNTSATNLLYRGNQVTYLLQILSQSKPMGTRREH